MYVKCIQHIHTHAHTYTVLCALCGFSITFFSALLPPRKNEAVKGRVANSWYNATDNRNYI